jgi:hypothetical protein
MRENYLVEHTVGSIIGGAFKILSSFRHSVSHLCPAGSAGCDDQGEAQLSGNADYHLVPAAHAYRELFRLWGDHVAPYWQRAQLRDRTQNPQQLMLLLLVTNLLQILVTVRLVLLIRTGAGDLAHAVAIGRHFERKRDRRSQAEQTAGRRVALAQL